MAKRNYELYRAVDPKLTPSEVFMAFNKDSRDVRTKVEIFFDGLSKPPYVLDPEATDEIIDWEILEELAQDSTHPVGSPIANELTLTLLNAADKFNPYNEEGPFYGKIKEYVPIRVWVTEASLLPEYIHMGTYYVANWSMKKSTGVVNVIAYNVYKQLLSAEVPLVPMSQNISVPAFLRDFFGRLGVTSNKLIIDKALDSSIMVNAYALDGLVKDTLNEVSKAYLCYIWMDRQDNIHVQSIKTLQSDDDYLLTDDNQIISVDMGYSITKQYNGVTVTYAVGRNIQTTLLLSLTDYTLRPGDTEIRRMKPSVVPVRSYNSIVAYTESKADCASKVLTGSPWEVSLIVHNASNDIVSGNINVYGTALHESTYASYTSVDKSNPKGKILEVSNVYVETYTQAADTADMLLDYITNDNAICDLVLRGTPSLELGTAVPVDDTTDSISFKGIVVQNNFSYDAAFSAKAKVLNKEAVTYGV